MSELKPCPFCGQSVASIGSSHEQEDHLSDDEMFAVFCDASSFNGVGPGGCGAMGGYAESEQEAIDKWNRRE